jgi:D-sedoheptulose 7-phosphate isomerase
MSIDELVQYNHAEHIRTFELVRETLATPIGLVGRVLASTLAAGGGLLWCGNGGSAADSQHLAAELVGRFQKNRRPLRSIALTTDTSILTCVANDFGYDDVFSRQVVALGRPGDALIGLSTSGRSENVLRAFRTAREQRITTVALLGKSGGPARDLADHVLLVPSDVTSRIQEAHGFIGHVLCGIIERELGFA